MPRPLRVRQPVTTPGERAPYPVPGVMLLEGDVVIDVALDCGYTPRRYEALADTARWSLRLARAERAQRRLDRLRTRVREAHAQRLAGVEG